MPIAEHGILGGGSRSALWCQIVADVRGAPVKRARSADATNLGAAVLAASAAGWYPTLLDAAAAITGTTDEFVPNRDAAAHYNRLYGDVYRHLFPALRPYVDRLTELTEDGGNGGTAV